MEAPTHVSRLAHYVGNPFGNFAIRCTSAKLAEIERLAAPFGRTAENDTTSPTFSGAASVTGGISRELGGAPTELPGELHGGPPGRFPTRCISREIPREARRPGSPPANSPGNSGAAAGSPCYLQVANRSVILSGVCIRSAHTSRGAPGAATTRGRRDFEEESARFQIDFGDARRHRRNLLLFSKLARRGNRRVSILARSRFFKRSILRPPELFHGRRSPLTQDRYILILPATVSRGARDYFPLIFD